MKSCKYLLVVGLLAGTAVPAPAGIFFNRKPAPINPAEHVPALLMTLKSDPNESRREAAAEELRNYEQYRMIVPALCDALLSDQSTSVRLEAARSLSRLRPITQQAGNALEQAMENDDSLRLRMQIRPMYWSYYLAGFRKGAADQPQTPRRMTTQEPPLAPPLENEAPTAQPHPMPPANKSSRMAPIPEMPHPLVMTAAEAMPQLQPVPEDDGPELTAPK